MILNEMGTEMGTDTMTATILSGRTSSKTFGGTMEDMMFQIVDAILDDLETRIDLAEAWLCLDPMDREKVRKTLIRLGTRRRGVFSSVDYINTVIDYLCENPVLKRTWNSMLPNERTAIHNRWIEICVNGE